MNELRRVRSISATQSLSSCDNIIGDELCKVFDYTYYNNRFDDDTIIITTTLFDRVDVKGKCIILLGNNKHTISNNEMYRNCEWSTV
jgi:hypothetical protein